MGSSSRLLQEAPEGRAIITLFGIILIRIVMTHYHYPPPKASPSDWALLKCLGLSYHNQEALLFTIILTIYELDMKVPQKKSPVSKADPARGRPQQSGLRPGAPELLGPGAP